MKRERKGWRRADDEKGGGGAERRQALRRTRLQDNGASPPRILTGFRRLDQKVGRAALWRAAGGQSVPPPPRSGSSQAAGSGRGRAASPAGPACMLTGRLCLTSRRFDAASNGHNSHRAPLNVPPERTGAINHDRNPPPPGTPARCCPKHQAERLHRKLRVRVHVSPDKGYRFPLMSAELHPDSSTSSAAFGSILRH